MHLEFSPVLLDSYSVFCICILNIIAHGYLTVFTLYFTPV